MTWIKICATTSLRDAQASVAAGANALGFIFAPSPRRIETSAAAEIIAAVPARSRKDRRVRQRDAQTDRRDRARGGADRRAVAGRRAGASVSRVSANAGRSQAHQDAPRPRVARQTAALRNCKLIWMRKEVSTLSCSIQAALSNAAELACRLIGNRRCRSCRRIKAVLPVIIAGGLSSRKRWPGDPVV